MKYVSNHKSSTYFVSLQKLNIGNFNNRWVVLHIIKVLSMFKIMYIAIFKYIVDLYKRKHRNKS